MKKKILVPFFVIICLLLNGLVIKSIAQKKIQDKCKIGVDTVHMPQFEIEDNVLGSIIDSALAMIEIKLEKEFDIPYLYLLEVQKSEFSNQKTITLSAYNSFPKKFTKDDYVIYDNKPFLIRNGCQIVIDTGHNYIFDYIRKLKSPGQFYVYFLFSDRIDNSICLPDREIIQSVKFSLISNNTFELDEYKIQFF